MGAVFISYRRDNSEGQAGRLYDDLVRRFGRDAVFMDVAGIEPGVDFRTAIDKSVTSCAVLLALIGPGWVDAKDENGHRRLDNPMDFVRLETASALKRDIPLVPVLVHGARMPTTDQLPDDLKELAYRNGVEITHARWDTDVQVLIKALERHISPKPEPEPQPKPNRLFAWIGAAIVLVLLIGVASRIGLNSKPTGGPKNAQQSDGPNKRVDQTPPMHSNGRLTVRGTWSYDLDAGVQATAGADFWWDQETDVKRYLVPENGAEFFVVGIRDFDSVKYPDLKRFQYSPQKIDGSNLAYNHIPQGTVVAYKTNEGRLGKFVVDEYGYNLTIRWVTFE